MDMAPSSPTSARRAALAARGWDGDDPGILRWEAAFRERVSDLRDDAGLQFFNAYVLAPGDWTALAAMEPSWKAFELLDHWFPTNFSGLTAAAAQVPEHLAFGSRSNIFQGSFETYPLLALLCQQHPQTDVGGLQVAKSLLLGAMFRNGLLVTASAVRECADGIRKAVTSANWRALVDWEELEYGLDLERTLDDAQRLFDAAAGRALQNRSEAHIGFVHALREVLVAVRTGAARLPLGHPHGLSDPDDDDEARPFRPVRELVSEEPKALGDQGTRTDSVSPAAESTAGEAREGESTAPADERSASLGGESDAHAEYRAMQTGFHAAITNQYLVIDHDQLLEHELKALVRALKSAMGDKSAITRRVAALLTTSLFTGETLTSILDSRVEPTTRPGFRTTGRWVRIVRPEPSAKVAPPQVRKYLARHGDRFELAIPFDAERYFSEALRNAVPGTPLSDALGDAPKVIVQQALDWLREFRKKHPRVLVGKLSRWLPTALYAKSHDHVAVHLLTAVESDPPCPAAYYRAPRAVDLQALHRRLVASVWNGDLVVPATPCTRVGSWWYPADGEFRRLYELVRQTMLARAADESLPLWRRHRAHQVMSALNIILATGMRRVSDPAESLDMFDLDRAMGVLDDKSGGPIRSHRVVPLSAVVVEQLELQRTYLQRLVATLGPLNAETATAIEALLAHPEKRIAPLFFLVDDRYRIRSLEPADIEAELGELWPFPLNFARHWLSTALRERGVDDTTICSFLGHNLIGTQNLSPVALQTAEAHFSPLRPKLQAVLRVAGLRAVAPFAMAGPEALATTSARLTHVQPLFEFGTARRARERAQQEEALQQELQTFLSRQVPDGDLIRLNRQAVTELFTELSKLTPLATSYKAYCLRRALRDQLAAVARRHQKDWPLPSVEVGIADFQITIDADAFIAARRVQILRQALRAVLDRPPAGTTSGGVEGDAATPVGLLALAFAAECLVLDFPVLRTWLAQPSLSIVGIESAIASPGAPELWLRMPLGRVGTRMHPIAPWLARAAAARARVDCGSHDLKSVDREIARFARDHGLDWLAGGLKVALRTIRAAASLSVCGMSLGFADGTHGGVSLPQSTLDRLVLGTVSATTLDAIREDEAARSTALDIHVIADDQALTHSNVSKDLLGVQAFMDTIAECFDQAAKFTMAKAAEMAHGSTRVEYLGVLVKEKFDALQEKTAVPIICGHLATWLAALCVKGARLKGKSDGTYSFKSLKTYWSNLARRLIEQVDVADLSTMDAIEIEEIYRDILEFADTENLDHIYAAMRVFHAHLMRAHGVPGLEWGPLAAMANQGPGRIDANLVLEREYLEALRLLRIDPTADARQRLMQSAVLVLCFRCGLRIGEAMGLRRKDITCVGGVWVVRIARNLYRNIKSDTSMRIVPVLERLDPLEQQTLGAWVDHADEYLDGRTTTALFNRAKGDRAMMPRSRVAAQIRFVLQRVTGDPAIRIHHCRHGLPNRLIAACTALRRSGNAHLEPLMRVWTEGRDLLGVLTQQEAPTRRLVWAIANILGHMPATLMRSYWHLGGELLGAEVRQRWWSAADSADVVSPDCCSVLKVVPDDQRQPHAWEWPVQLPPVEPLSAELVDRAIDMLRRHGRADGIADALLISEHQVEDVAAVAGEMVRDSRGDWSERQDWWFAGQAVVYSPSQVTQAQRALAALSQDLTDEVRAALEQLGECLDDRQHMVMVETPRQFKRFAALLNCLVDEASNVEMVLPTKTVKRLTPEQRMVAEANGTAPKRGRPSRDALMQPLALDDVAWQPWLRLAQSQGFNTTRRSHLLAARGGGRNRKLRQLRVGLRIRQNGNDRVHDAKTAARVLTSAAVWHALVSTSRDGATEESSATSP